MGRLDVGVGVTVEAEDSLLDKLEDLDPVDLVDINIDLQRGSSRADRAPERKPDKSARRRLEDRLDELRLKRQLTDYDYRLH